MSYAYIYLASIYSELNKFDEAKKYSNMNIDNMESAYTRYKTPALRDCFISLLCSHETHGCFSLQESKTYCLKAINIAEDSINTNGESFALSDSLGLALRSTSRFFFSNSEYEPARDMSLRYQAHCVNKIQQYGKSLQHIWDLANSKYLLFQIESQLECIDEAKSYCLGSIELIEECLANYSDELEFCGNLWMRKALYSDLYYCCDWLVGSDESEDLTTMRLVLPKIIKAIQRLIELDFEIDSSALYQDLGGNYHVCALLHKADKDFQSTKEFCAKGIEATEKAIELSGDDAEYLEDSVGQLNELEELKKYSVVMMRGDV